MRPRKRRGGGRSTCTRARWVPGHAGERRRRARRSRPGRRRPRPSRSGASTRIGCAHSRSCTSVRKRRHSSPKRCGSSTSRRGAGGVVGRLQLQRLGDHRRRGLRVGHPEVVDGVAVVVDVLRDRPEALGPRKALRPPVEPVDARGHDAHEGLDVLDVRAVEAREEQHRARGGAVARGLAVRRPALDQGPAREVDERQRAQRRRHAAGQRGRPPT